MKLDRPLYGEYATGPLAGVLCFRHTVNPPDLPGEPVVYCGTVAQLPASRTQPSAAQAAQRSIYAVAVAGWRALDDADKAFYVANRPSNLSAFNFYLRLHLVSGLAYFGYCVFGDVWFQYAAGPDQPAAVDYSSLFPASGDEFPIIREGADSLQDWPFNRVYESILSVESYLLAHMSTINGGG